MRSRQLLLVCGIVSSALYVGTDLLAAVREPAYHSFSAQTISELMAHGAPTKALVDPLYTLYGVLALAFGVGVWRSARDNRGLRVTGGLVSAYALLCLPGPWFFAMNLRGSGDVRADVPHLALTGVLVLIIMAALVSGALALGGWFRVYSFATLAATMVFGALTGVGSRGIATGEPTPWVGLAERADIGAFMLWVVVLAVVLLRREAGASVPPRPARLGEVGT